MGTSERWRLSVNERGREKNVNERGGSVCLIGDDTLCACGTN